MSQHVVLAGMDGASPAPYIVSHSWICKWEDAC